MAHKALIGGTAYSINKGKTLIGGTAYSINKGKTLVGGTAYSIAFLTGNEAGLYKNGELLYLWEDLISKGAVTLEGTAIADYSTSSTYGGDLRIPEGITMIGPEAFRSCTFLTSIVVPNSVVTIGSSAFRSCSKLVTVTIGTGVKTIGNYFVYGCSALTDVIFKYTSGWYGTTDANATSGTALDVSNSAVCAQWLTVYNNAKNYLKRN